MKAYLIIGGLFSSLVDRNGVEIDFPDGLFYLPVYTDKQRAEDKIKSLGVEKQLEIFEVEY